MQKKYRQSNMELLRILAMFLVLVVHANFKSIGIPTEWDFVNNFTLSFCRVYVESVAIVCVNVFVLISGWFCINPNFKRFCELLFQILFISATVNIILVVFGISETYNVKDWIKSLYSDSYWFIPSYLILYTFTPVLNAFAKNSSKKDFLVLLLSFFCFQTIFSFILNISWFEMGYSPISFMGLYLIARYLRIWPNRLTCQVMRFYLFGFIGLSLILTIIAILVLMYGIGRVWMWYYYTSPIVIMESLFLLLLFSKIKLSSKLVNWVAISSFSVYLVHSCSVFFNGIYISNISRWFEVKPTIAFLIYSLLFMTFVFGISIILDKLRIIVWTLLCTWMIKVDSKSLLLKK